ncbi:hypothetical protein ACIGG6_10190 [Vreelandella lionensis]|uniref:DUF3037 domain-containing protein n=1 Tax=Vreelandella lionensis TaxID=1144478 RepID=A0ABW8BT15_9GAMM|tara:strand:+ start:971 stop:1756 length:786 start_codon:yes stop_codon:yes gene_type:complete
MNNKFVLNWWPVYLEPILDSDEKICVGICYQNHENEFFYKNSLRKDLAELIFDDRKVAVGNLSRHACEYAVRLLKGGGEVGGLEIASGVYLGNRRLIEGYDLGEMHSRALKKVSFFSYIEFYSKESTPSEPRKEFANFVQDQLIKRQSRLAGFFNRQLRVSGAVKNFDFADDSGGLAVNFFVFQKNSRIYKAEVSCLDLSMVKSQFEQVSLVVMIDKGYRSKSKRLRSYKEVEGVANHLDISFKIVDSSKDAADYLQERVA